MIKVMTFANTGVIGAMPGSRDKVVEILVRSSPDLVAAGCLLYEVGTAEDAPDSVFVVELWESSDAHQASLQLPSVQASIKEAMPLLSGEMSGNRFDVVGSPIRS